MNNQFEQDLIERLNTHGCVLVPYENDRYVVVIKEEGHPTPNNLYRCAVFNTECDSDFDVVTVGSPEEAIRAHQCEQCYVIEGDGSCCGCVETQREQGRYEELWGEED